MRSIHQHGTTFISIPRTTSDQDCGSVIDKSKSERATENAAIQMVRIGDDGKDFITEKRPATGYEWCSLCGWRPVNRFGKNADRASGYDNYCKDCRRKIRKIKLASKRLTT